MPYLTPSSGDLPGISLFTLPVPAGSLGRAIVSGALSELAAVYNWEKSGTATPEAAAQAFVDATAQAWRSRGPDTDYLAHVQTYNRGTHYCHYPLSQSPACCVGAGRSLSLLAGALIEHRDGAGDGLAGFYFDGGDNRLSFPMASMAFDFPSNEGAFLVWARLDAWEYEANLRWHRILHFTDYLGQDLEIYRRGATVSDFSLTRTTSGIARTVTTTIAPGSPEFTCFGADWSTSTGVIEFFINGVSVGTAPAGLGWRSAPTVGRIGGRTADHFFAGSIAHVAMWSAPLGAAGHAALGVL